MATYLAIADEVERRISGQPPGTRVASEHRLAAEFGVNRLTAREVLRELERRYLVRRAQGAGTFVAERFTYRVAASMPPSFTETLRQVGVEPRQQIIEVRTEPAPAELLLPLRLAEGDKVTVVRRLSWIGGRAVSYGASWLPADRVPDLAGHMREQGSIYRVLREGYGYEPVRLWCRAELDCAPPDVAVWLGLEGRPLVWHLESGNGERPGGQRLEVTRGWLRADVFRLVFELGAIQE